MTILNASFIINRNHEEMFKQWFSEVMATINAVNPVKCTLTAMRDANGISYLESEAHTMAAQWTFENIEQACKWRDRTLPEIGKSFNRKFGADVPVFSSIFEVVQTYDA